MSVMIKDLLTTYKLGWKTSYYQNTYDYKTDPSDVEEEQNQKPLEREEFSGTDEEYEEYCEACAI